MEGDRIDETSSDSIREVAQRPRSLQGRTSGPTRRSTKGQWTPEEDEILRQAVERFNGKNWKKIGTILLLVNMCFLGFTFLNVY